VNWESDVSDIEFGRFLLARPREPAFTKEMRSIFSFRWCNPIMDSHSVGASIDFPDALFVPSEERLHL
jgi:hypothetical protein